MSKPTRKSGRANRAKHRSTILDVLHKQMISSTTNKTWWEKEVVQYAFTHPHVRSRLERLMGTNVVRITDRRFMQHLQKRIQEDHEAQLEKRILQRESEEVDREKRLLLDGKIPVELAPKELADHPVFKITQLTTKVIEVRRSLRQPPNVMTTSFYGRLGADDEMSNVGAGEAAAVSGGGEVITRALQPDAFVDMDILNEEDELDDGEEDMAEEEAEDDVSRGYMFTQEEYDRLKYESPLVKQLRTIETVEEMYRLADEIVGPLRTLRRK